MPPALRPPTTSRRPGLAARLTLALAAFFLAASGVFLPAGRAGATTAPSTLSLVRQTPIVTSSAGMQLTVAVSSSIPPKDLGLQVTLYNQATERGYFEQTVQGNLAGFVAIDQAPVIALSTRGLLSPAGDALLHLPVSAPLFSRSPKAPRHGALLNIPCGSQCPGVYPLQVSLVDTRDAIPLDSFITYLVIAPHAVSSRLHFSLVVPVGLTPAYDPAGAPAPAADDEAELELLSSELGRSPSVSCSLVVSPQFAGALEQAAGRPGGGKAAAARRALAALRRLTALPNVELEADTYAPVDVAALTATRLAGELGPQLALGQRLLRRLGAAVDPARFVSQWPLGPAAVKALAGQGVHQLVVPSSSVLPFPPSRWEFPVWAPFFVRGSAGSVVADASDGSLEGHLASGGNPVLRADQLLADLALLYFVEQPPQPRGVTLLAPAGWRPSRSFLGTLVAGLAHDPLLESDSLAQFFAQVPPGSAEAPLRIRGMAPPSIPRSHKLDAGRLLEARLKLTALVGLLPRSSPLIDALSERVLLGESAGLSRPARDAYLAAPARTLRRLARQITLPVGKTITITSLSAKVPISIYSGSRYPLRVAVSLQSADLSFRVHELALTLHPKNNTREISVSARTAGDFPFELSVRTRSGSFMLAQGRVLIRSTAISGVAVGLSAGAVVFLFVWWGRSVLKKRRGRHVRRGSPSPPAAVTSADAT